MKLPHTECTSRLRITHGCLQHHAVSMISRKTCHWRQVTLFSEGKLAEMFKLNQILKGSTCRIYLCMGSWLAPTASLNLTTAHVHVEDLGRQPLCSTMDRLYWELTSGQWCDRKRRQFVSNVEMKNTGTQQQSIFIQLTMATKEVNNIDFAWCAFYVCIMCSSCLYHVCIMFVPCALHTCVYWQYHVCVMSSQFVPCMYHDVPYGTLIWLQPYSFQLQRAMK